MGYFSRLAVDLLEQDNGRIDRELMPEEDYQEPTTNQELAAEWQETQYSIWNTKYRTQLEELAKPQQPKEEVKVYQKNKRPQ